MNESWHYMCCGGGVSLTFIAVKRCSLIFLCCCGVQTLLPMAPLLVNYYASMRSSCSSGFSSAVTDKAHRVHHNYLIFNKDFMKGVSEQIMFFFRNIFHIITSNVVYILENCDNKWFRGRSVAKNYTPCVNQIYEAGVYCLHLSMRLSSLRLIETTV